MEPLTYPFYHPPAALTEATVAHTAEGHNNDEAPASSVASTALPLGSAPVSSDGHGGARPDNNDDNLDDVQLNEADEGTRIRRANDAFSKLRTSDFSNPDNIPASWRSFQPPSLKKGHWRSFGPLQVRVFSVDDNELMSDSTTNKSAPQKSDDNETRKLDKQEKRRLDKATKKLVSSACEGTLWITEDKLLFVLLDETTTLTIKAEEEQQHRAKSGKSISSWIKGLLKSSSAKDSTGGANQKDSSLPDSSAEHGPLPEFVEGHHITGFQLPLSSITKIYYRSPVIEKDAAGNAISRRSSLSTTLSRTSTRNSHKVVGSPTLSRSVSRKSADGGAGKDSGNPVIDLEADESQKVTVRADGNGKGYKLDFSFLSAFYAGEPGDFVARLQTATAKPVV